MDYPLAFWKLSENDYSNRILSLLPAKEVDNAIEIKNFYSWFLPGFEDGVFTIEFWVDKKDIDNFGIFMQNENGSCIGAIGKVKEYIAFMLGSKIVTKSIPDIEGRINIYCVYNQKKMQIFINGIPSETLVLEDSFKFQDGVEKFVVSNISDLAFFARQLSDNEIKAHLSWENYTFKEHKEVLSDFFEDAK